MFSQINVFAKLWKFHRMMTLGICFLQILSFIAVYAPLICNSSPLITTYGHGISFPALASVFYVSSQEVFVETFLNYLMLLLPALLFTFFLLRGKKRILISVMIAVSVLLSLPFFLFSSKNNQPDWKKIETEHPEFIYIYPLISWSPTQTTSDVYENSSGKHYLGTDQIGRDVCARMIYGARISLSVGLFSSFISLLLGTIIGLLSGYRGGRFDVIIQRMVEILICFPTFLLLLILMSIMLDSGSRQSILLVILVLGFTDWPGLCRLVRGEVLKQRQMAYMLACESLGVPMYRKLFVHLLPNVIGPILVFFTFSVASAILAENSLSFLGFGVQEPQSSWGELLRQAFSDPLAHWNLMLWPGLAIFFTVCSINFIADGMRKYIVQG